MKIEQTTFNLNLTIVGEDEESAKIQVEGIDPFTKDEFWTWIIRATRAGELPKTSRPSAQVWKDTKESPQPKSVLEKMNEFNREYKKIKRRFPQASREFLTEKTREFIALKEKALEDFKEKFKLMLEGKE